MFFSNRKSKRAISYQVPKYLFTSKFSTAFAFLGIEAQELKRVRTPTERAATKILFFVFIIRIFKLLKKSTNSNPLIHRRTSPVSHMLSILAR